MSFLSGTLTRPNQLPLFVLGVALGACRVSAAESSPILQEPVALKATAPARPAALRVVSPRVAEMLAAVAPKYVPRDAVKPGETAAQESGKSRDGIILLSPFVVRELKLPYPKKRDVLTAAGRLELALKRHSGFRLGSIGPSESKHYEWATAMLEEELSRERQNEMQDLSGLLPGTKAPPLLLLERPTFLVPRPASGPWGGMVVPWERK